MKPFSNSILLVLLAAASASVASPAAQQHVFDAHNHYDIQNTTTTPTSLASPPFSSDTCPIDAISCSRTDVDSCCSPTNGLLVLALQWDTRWGPSNAFTVHGLWPDTCEGKQLPSQGCDPQRSYTNISGIIQTADPLLHADMNTYWPSNKGDNDWFWTHEWVKHGTCVTTLHPRCYGADGYQPRQEVADYFRKILELRENYNLFKVLAKGGVVPTEPEVGRRPKNTYSLKQFKQAIKNEWGVEPNVRCIGRRLQEVFLWFKVRGRDNYYLVEPHGRDSCGAISYQRKSTGGV